jgi:oxygen-independent coproporphyrinogen-3 oxidase
MNAPLFGQALDKIILSVPEYQPKTFGIYFHVPFCVSKCGYCSFYSIPDRKRWLSRYTDALHRTIQQDIQDPWAKKRKATTLFFGGGTPSLLPVEQLLSLVRHSLDVFSGQQESMEISIEVNPATIDFNGLQDLRQGGFNRLSIGVQSLDEAELLHLGRAHTSMEAVSLFTDARKAGFSNISLDLMYGLPGQSPASWQQTLTRALELHPDHLSLYELTLESGTPFHCQYQQGRLSLPTEDEVLAMMEFTKTIVTAAGLQRYEISNYARCGKTCLHNIQYWHNGSWLGFGASAVSSRSGLRSTMVADMELFCRQVEKGGSIIEETEKLTKVERFRETIIMGLRMSCGVSLASLESRFGIAPCEYYGEILESLIEQRLLEERAGFLRLTDQGMLLANQVMQELV